MGWKFNKQPAAEPAAAPAAAAPVTPPAPSAGAVPPPTAPTAAPVAAAAVLPPVQPAVDPTPAAAAAPRTRRARTTTVDAQATVVASQPMAATNGQAVARVAEVAIPQGGGRLARMLYPQAPVRMAAAAITEAAERTGGELNLFPTLSMTGGSSGGAFKLDRMNEEHSDDDLQEGTRPMYGVLVGYRVMVMCWPRIYVEGAKRDMPKWRSIIDSKNPDDAALLEAAYRVYQFRSGRPEKGIEVDPVWDPVGHPAAAVELMVFDAKAGLICVRSPWSYDSLIATTGEISGVWKDGLMNPKPVIITPVTEPRASKNKTWKAHYPKMAHHIGPETREAGIAFDEFRKGAMEDPDLDKALAAWESTSLTDEQRDILDTMTRMR